MGTVAKYSILMQILRSSNHCFGDDLCIPTFASDIQEVFSLAKIIKLNGLNINYLPQLNQFHCGWMNGIHRL
jgi:hypothetical protein